MSLTDALLGQLAGSQMGAITKAVGADEGATKTAVTAALPMLMAALAKNAATPEGASALDQALERDHDGSMMDDVAGFLGKASPDEGNGILKHVLGARRGPVEAGLSAMSGLDSGQANGLLAMLAPLVMGALGRAKKEQGLDAGALASALTGESQQHESKLGMLGGLLDHDGDGDIKDDLMGGLAKGLGGKLFGGR